MMTLKKIVSFASVHQEPFLMRNLMVTFQYVSEPSLETTRFLTGRSNCLHIKKGNKMKKKMKKKRVR